MGSIALFRLVGETPIRLDDSPATVERELQAIVERNLDTYLGVTFLATEFTTGQVHGGRIDTLGIDENQVPVIIEYKRRTDENVINQGLFYLDWLLDHRGDFTELVRSKAGQSRADNIDWSKPRVVCIAGDFTRYDEHAVQQIDRSIELLRYRKYGDDLLLFETVSREPDSRFASIAKGSTDANDSKGAPKKDYDAFAYKFENASDSLKGLFDELVEYLESFEQVTRRDNKLYVAYKRIKNFACIEIVPKSGFLNVYAKVDPASIELTDGFTRDVSQVGHWGTGDFWQSLCDQQMTLRRPSPLLSRATTPAKSSASDRRPAVA